MVFVVFAALSLVTGVTTAQGRYSSDSIPNTPFDHDKTTANNSSVSIHHDGTPLVLDTAANQTIRGTTTLDPGTKLEVQVHATKQFFMSNSVTVQHDGNFNASFNFSKYEPGTELGVTVVLPRNNSTKFDALASIDGVLHQSIKSSLSSRSTTATTTATTTVAMTTTTAATGASTTMSSSTSSASSTSVTNRAMNDTTNSVTETMTPDQRTTNDSQPGFGIVVALIALAGIGFVRRKR